MGRKADLGEAMENIHAKNKHVFLPTKDSEPEGLG